MSNEKQQIPLVARKRLEESDLLDGQAPWMVVDTQKQQLFLCEGDEVRAVYPISTAAQGTGCEADSFRTPTGIHRIAEKIGDGEPAGLIFEGRISTGRIAEIQTEPVATSQDLITSRIMWLEGMEPEINQGGDVDSHNRYIYIHGTNEEGLIGQAVSHGCVRLLNKDVIKLYDEVDSGTLVLIV